MIFWISHHSELLLSKFEQWLVPIVVNNPHPTRWSLFYNRVYILEYFNKMKDKEAEPCLTQQFLNQSLCVGSWMFSWGRDEIIQKTFQKMKHVINKSLTDQQKKFDSRIFSWHIQHSLSFVSAPDFFAFWGGGQYIDATMHLASACNAVQICSVYNVKNFIRGFFLCSLCIAYQRKMIRRAFRQK